VEKFATNTYKPCRYTHIKALLLVMKYCTVRCSPLSGEVLLSCPCSMAVNPPCTPPPPCLPHPGIQLMHTSSRPSTSLGSPTWACVVRGEATSGYQPAPDRSLPLYQPLISQPSVAPGPAPCGDLPVSLTCGVCTHIYICSM
jgi:hypothetical protein